MSLSQRSRLSRSASVAKPIDYMRKRWHAFARFLDDGRMEGGKVVGAIGVSGSPNGTIDAEAADAGAAAMK